MDQAIFYELRAVKFATGMGKMLKPGNALGAELKPAIQWCVRLDRRAKFSALL